MSPPGVTLQLFPPPQRPRQSSPNRKLHVKPPSPEPRAERMDSAKSAKAPVDFHELVIQVNSVPVSPSSTAHVAMPERAQQPQFQMTRTPPQLSIPIFQPPPTQANTSPVINRGSPSGYTAGSPALSVQSAQRHAMPFPSGSPDLNRAPSPAFSDIRSAHSGSPTLVRPNSGATNRSPISPSSPVPMRSMFPVYNPSVPLARQEYAPTQTSPTHIPTNRIHRSPYSPEIYIPHANVNGNGSNNSPEQGENVAPVFNCAPYFTPAALLDNLWVAANGQEEPTVQIYTLKMHRASVSKPQVTFGPTASLPFYSLTQPDVDGRDPLELATMTHEVLVQRHHPSQPRALPINHLDLVIPPSSAAGQSFEDSPSILLGTIYPKLAALAALDAAANSPAASHIAHSDPGATSPAAQRLAEDVLRGAAERECCALTWTREPPSQQTNPWAHALSPAGSYQLHHPTLGVFPIHLDGDCSGINSPSTRPQTAVYGHHNSPFPQYQARQSGGSITLLNPYILSPSSPRAFNPPLPPTPLRSPISPSTRPHSMFSDIDPAHLATANDAAADDAVLARLDFTTDSLLLNVAALTRFGNPYLVDVAATALLSIAVAEAARNPNHKHASLDGPALFDAPPPSIALGPKQKSSAASFKESFVEGFEALGGKRGGKKWSLRSSATTSKTQSLDKDIELGQWYGQEEPKSKSKSKSKAKAKEAEKEDESSLPFIARTLISVLTFAFKAVVWMLGLAFKVVAGVVVMLSKNASKL